MVFWTPACAGVTESVFMTLSTIVRIFSHTLADRHGGNNFAFEELTLDGRIADGAGQL